MKAKTAPFSKVLVANRGEIACRVISACRALGLKTVAVYSEADAQATHVRVADEAVLLGPGPAAESYLNPTKILAAVQQSGAQAIHPGYGFMSERASFAAAVVDAGLVWIGPASKVIDLMGNKIAAKLAAEKVGFPLLLKAAAGGGGRGMRMVAKDDELDEKAESAIREAQGAFGSGEIFLEAYCKASRHIEVQVLGDSHGSIISLGERECSVQRRHQKVIEEAPAPNLSEATRHKLWAAAVALAKAVDYVNAGTCEFLVDDAEKFYFLEMNTRLQVEHPVTELVWGVDLPALQLKVAQGEKLPPGLGVSGTRGHAIEARVYAEDPSKGFMPAPGKLEEFTTPLLPHLRVDTGYQTGCEVPMFYDAMLAKIIAWGMEREQARRTLAAGLRGTRVCGVAWNGAYLVDILEHQRFIDGKVTTQFLGDELSGWKGQVRWTTEKPASAKAEAPASLSPWQVFGTGGGKVGYSGSGAGAKPGAGGAHDFTVRGPLIAEYPGKVLKVLVAPGQKVSKDQVVVVCESMKMEFSYAAPFETTVRTVGVKEGQVIAAGILLVDWEDEGK
ncbi:MAG: hypothetical protein HY074_14890 [Deltaproteobacteria bacterium]|nr:hypothetical protein [Deltaproteobacteria bacterium]